uniref:Chromosome partition protein Smc n=1 Tax=Heterorhabditis bacteriophora TaxID=37862 RepID=A0A1I7XDY7_HETBA
MISLNEVTARLARVESERMGHVDSQLDVLRLERDSLKTSSARLADQLTHARNETKQIQTRLEQEFSLAKQQLVEKENELAISNKQLVELRTRLATVQAQYTAQDTTIGKYLLNHIELFSIKLWHVSRYDSRTSAKGVPTAKKQNTVFRESSR